VTDNSHTTTASNKKWRQTVNPWDNPAEGPPLDTIVETSCCGLDAWAKFLPARNMVEVFDTLESVQAGEGEIIDAAADGYHLPEQWRPARLPKTVTLLEATKEAHRLESMANRLAEMKRDELMQAAIRTLKARGIEVTEGDEIRLRCDDAGELLYCELVERGQVVSMKSRR
jgi:hypothetical protein